MLAHKLTPRKKPSYPFYVQPKLNGIRALWDGKDTLWSRDGKPFSSTTLPHIYRQLANIDLPLDGELYCHGLSLQQINSRVAVKRVSAHANVFVISYHVFDSISSKPFEERRNETIDAVSSVGFETTSTAPFSITPVQTILITSPTSEEGAYRLFKKQHYEGMMYRSITDPYGFPENCGNQENRWNCLLKRKDWLDLIAKVVDVEEGEGQFREHVGAFWLEEDDGTRFKAGSGLTIFQRKAFWEQVPYGRKVKVNYEMRSDDGTPLKATIEEVQ